MNETEFIASLNAEQATFYNARLVSIRTELQAMYTKAEADLVVAHKAIADDLATQLTEKQE